MLLLLLCSLVAMASCASRTCRGDIKNLNPTGKRIGGVGASNADVQSDLQYLNKYKSCFQEAADENCIQASVLAAIASRESRGGSLLVRTGGYGDNGKAWGIMQCDIAKSRLNCKSCGWDSCCHIKMMTAQILVPNIRRVKSKFPSWSQDQALQGGVAAYNFGVDNVRSWDRLDIGTTGHDYCNDVIARAQYLYGLGWD